MGQWLLACGREGRELSAPRSAQKSLNSTSIITLHTTGLAAFMAGLNFQAIMVFTAF
jgi:hypothetical protein